ncbi:hypothetical protein [Mesohalobacter halotolerans]|uniref:Multidrug transporter n=1 Tax=Mesohalobacter halotolerans TaxID=1883405 RepID=A0A4V6ALP5_9FLAO|nr:hypothetical protein [Mesohalobacter halotolerans]TKS57525.1 hypothetical protein FCN74_03670 [Mesohalobacter halotolerans]
MKTTIKSFAYLLTILAFTFTVISCSDDDDNGTTPPPGGDDTELGGDVLTEDLTLDPTENYTLNGILSVEAGATLTIPAGTTITTGTGTDVYIVVQKDADIVINGEAGNPVVMEPGSTGVWGGLVIAGNGVTTNGVDAVAEVGGILYGGNDNQDDSGSINYLILKQTGAQINPESQYNGLTLYAVGEETSLSNIAVLNGQDDGVEFFGGKANLTNFYAENMEDDSVDWTEGWSGSLTNTYVLHANTNFSTAIEADGENGNPTIDNFRAVSLSGGTALQFKANSGATMSNVSLLGYSILLDRPDNAPLSGIQIDGANANPNGSYDSSTVSPSDFDWVTGRQTVSFVTNPELGGLNLTGINILDSSVDYTLNGIVSVDSGSLTIPAGTTVTTGTGTDVYMVVQKGADIFINGSESNPVVMEPGSTGVWGGLVIAGDAETTNGVDAVAEVGGIIYGGSNPDDNSGIVNYLVLKETGAQINPESQYNGLTLYAVGSGTTLQNVAVLDGQDDGVEFFGGSANLTNFYARNMEDDSVDWTEGWNGSLTNSFVKHENANFSTAIEADGENGNPTIENFVAENTSGTTGTALQFKANSGATITGITLTGYDPLIDRPDGAPLSGIQIDGADADPNGTYTSGTVTEADFSWATN